MSLLRDLLKRGKSPENLPLSSKRNIKNYASSIKSSGGASMRSLAESVSSFYSTMTGSGPRVPKRRRADFSTIGVPQWYADDPPPAPEMPGTAIATPSEIPVFTMAHSMVMHATDAGVEPWLGLVLYSHAPASNPIPMYHNGAKIAGEVRMVLDKPTNLRSIDVWKGDPSAMAAGVAHFKGKFPAGTFVFPFEFVALPTDTMVKHPDEERRKNKGRVPLPPTYSLSMVGGFSGNIKYTIGVNVAREGIAAIDEEFDMTAPPPCQNAVPVPADTGRLAVHAGGRGGWTLTPFGGRGRLGEELVEVEGILGIQEPAVYTAGQTLEFSLMLWSANPLALEALAQPGAIEVGRSSRKNRNLERLASGRIWLTEAGKPAEDDPLPECVLVTLPETSNNPKLSTSSGAGAGTSKVKGAPSSRLQEVWIADSDDADDVTLAGDATLSKNESTKEPSSPTPSSEDLNDMSEPESVVRLDGEVRIPPCSHPSFRFASMAREYVLHLLIKHPQYSHISPSATGIIAEVPVWYVLNRFGHLAPGAAQEEADLGALAIKGSVIPRPTFRAQRVAAF
ncbi:hypothetical protein B0H13DRAFT_2310932 [Mycena leptocephala]|nr:hypothetical protein B0H13DRAFT_2310932 [Mycena leptocephala]